MTYNQAKLITIKLIGRGNITQADIDEIYNYQIKTNFHEIINNSIQNKSIKLLFTLAQLCMKRSLSPVDKIVVIKCLKGFTEQSTQLAYETLYNTFIRYDTDLVIPESDSI